MEINGFGVIERRGSDLVIVNALIARQRATRGSVVTDGAALLEEIAVRGIKLEQVVCQWHSHVNWKAEFSPRDIRQINSWTGGFMVSIVANKHGDVSCRLDCYEPLRMAFAAPLEVVVDHDDILLAECEQEIKEKVTIVEPKREKRRSSWRTSEDKEEPLIAEWRRRGR